MERIIKWLTRRPRALDARVNPRNPLSTLPDDLRIHAIGDIHGCADLLARHHAAIDRGAAERPKGRIIEVVLGDMIDRGPDSRGVIDQLIERSRWREIVTLRGNHENMLLRFLSDPTTLNEWIRFGGLETLLSYGVTPAPTLDADGMVETARRAHAAIPAEHVRFLQNTLPIWSCADFVFVHAGLRPGRSLVEQDEHDLLEIRQPFLQHTGWFGAYVVHGHTPVADIDIRRNRMNLDTGAFATGRLSGVALERDRLFSLRTNSPQAAAPPPESALADSGD
ncbi:metallophosphoesterase [Terrarubrum flagellatum]|uniref:metallophosphoesterase n=1 Tax=Terrirubrum flagellatum TaxID=2895980 RepID=UPI00314559A3